MADSTDGLAGQAGQLWKRLPGRGKAVLAAGIAVPLALVGFLALSSPEPSWAILYSGLSPEDAGELVGELDRRGIRYRIKAGGTVVEVPEDRVHEVRLSTAAAGLPRGGGVGFEIFDEQSFGTSSFVEQVNYRRALQGELSRSISSLAAVEGARVHVATGKRSVFRESDEPPSASVALKLRPGRKLARGQVEGIVNLVASSVDGLDPAKVVVIDDRGNVLSESGEDQPGADRELESKLAARVRSMLERVVGPGRAAVTVTAKMDYRKIDQTEEIYDQKEPAVRSETRTVEGDAPAPGTVGGVAGTRGNLPGAPAPVAKPAGGKGGRFQETRNYEVNRVLRRTVEPTARVARLHLAVLVDYGRDDEGKPVARTDDELAQLGAIARQAAGIDEARGDKVEVRSVPFTDQIEPAVAADEPAAASPLPVPIPVAVGAGVGLLVIIGVVFMLIRSRRKRKGAAELVALPAPVGDLEAALASEEAGAIGEGGEPLGLQAPDLHTRVLEAVSEAPPRAARVLAAWLSEAAVEERAA